VGFEREVADRIEIRDLAFRYARAVDRRDWALAETLFTEDATLKGPRFELVGRAQIVRGLRSVERYRATFHGVHNQTLEIAGDEAAGETYCVAKPASSAMARAEARSGIRYQDAAAAAEMEPAVHAGSCSSTGSKRRPALTPRLATR
jgi:hypothetical protein